MSFKIKNIHAFIAEDKDGTEGVIGMKTPDGWMPFVCADEARIEYLRPIAQQIATTTKNKVKLVRFSVRENLEIIE